MLHAVAVGSVAPGPDAVPKFGVGPKRQELMFAQSVLLADIVVLVASFFVAYLVRTQLWYGGMLPLRGFVWCWASSLCSGRRWRAPSVSPTRRPTCGRAACSC
jgi:hypothetical protein